MIRILRNHLTITLNLITSRSMGVKDITFLGFLDDGSSPHWSEMTASCMLGLDEDSRVVETGSLGGGPEVSAACIHLGVRRARPDLRAVFHLHPPYSTALACTREPTVLQGPDSKEKTC